MFLLALFFWGGRDEFVFLQCVFESWPLRRDATLYSKSYAPADPDPDRGRSAAPRGGAAQLAGPCLAHHLARSPRRR